MKKKLRIKNILLLIILLLIIGGIIFFFITKEDKIKNPKITLESQLLDLGYQENEISIIKQLKNPNTILDLDYNSNLINYIKNENFIEENLEKYLEFGTLYSFPIEDIIYVVNQNYFDTNITYDEDTIDFMKQTYYVHENLERYKNYKQSSNQDQTNDYYVMMVNSNRDYNFYTNVKETDLSKGYLMIVNKYYQLKSDYVPENLVTIEAKYGVQYQLENTVYEQYKKMWEDAYKEGLTLYINSPYRSYNTQSALYQRYASQDGYANADTYSARAGYSEHQTGLAFDVTSRTTNFSTFEYSNEFKWMQENAHKYGFILRYPKNKTNITGYIYEPWHYRYVGIEDATKIKELGITFEEYYEYYVK